MIESRARDSLGSGSLRWVAGLVALTIVALALASSSSASAAFCSGKVTSDLLAPIDRPSPVPTLAWPRKGLPFGPAGLRLIKKSEIQRQSPVVVTRGASVKGMLGFDLVNKTFERPGTAHLDWTVTAQLIRLGGRQKPLMTTTEQVKSLRRNSRRQFKFPVPTSPGRYVVQIEFSDGTDGKLGHFGDFFRITKPALTGRITLSKTEVLPGQSISACLENFGSQNLTYGSRFQIESFDGSAWVPSSLGPDAFGGPGRSLPPGRSGVINSFQIPSDTPIGRYRWVFSSIFGSLGLVSEFQVLSPYRTLAASR